MSCVVSSNVLFWLVCCFSCCQGHWFKRNQKSAQSTWANMTSTLIMRNNDPWEFDVFLSSVCLLRTDDAYFRYKFDSIAICKSANLWKQNKRLDSEIWNYSILFLRELRCYGHLKQLPVSYKKRAVILFRCICFSVWRSLVRTVTLMKQLTFLFISSQPVGRSI